MAAGNEKPEKPIRIKGAIDKYELSRSTLERKVNAGLLTRYKFGRAAFLDETELISLFIEESQNV